VDLLLNVQTNLLASQSNNFPSRFFIPIDLFTFFFFFQEKRGGEGGGGHKINGEKNEPNG